MVKSIALRAIGPKPIARRRIATRSQAAVGLDPYNFMVGTSTFTAPQSGYWKFVGWGPGASTFSNANSGDSGAYGEITRFLPKGAQVPIVAGVAGGSPGTGTDTTITFPDGRVYTAGCATGTGGAGLGAPVGGWDFSLPGNAGAVGTTPGGDGPSHGSYRGGTGGNSGAGNLPGGGAASGTGAGGGGMVIVSFVRT